MYYPSFFLTFSNAASGLPLFLLSNTTRILMKKLLGSTVADQSCSL